MEKVTIFKTISPRPMSGKTMTSTGIPWKPSEKKESDRQCLDEWGNAELSPFAAPRHRRGPRRVRRCADQRYDPNHHRNEGYPVQNGSQGCNWYIISHAEHIFAVLFVFSLSRWRGCGPRRGARGHRPAVRVDGRHAERRRHHRRSFTSRNTGRISFSAGTDIRSCWGFRTAQRRRYLQTNWSIYTTKETLSSVGGDYGIQAIFFYGRGGPPARGAGKPIAFMRRMVRILPIM